VNTANQSTIDFDKVHAKAL